MQQEAEKSRRKLEALGGRNESLAAGEYMRNSTEYNKLGRPILSANGTSENMFIATNGGPFG
jgi:hypothetical protein